MAWANALRDILNASRTLVGRKTVAETLSSPDSRLTWRGVSVSPVELHRDAGLPRDVYATARCISSEVGTSSPHKVLAVAEAIRNQAARKGVDRYQYLVGLTAPEYDWTRWKYGEQHGRRASTRQDPDRRGVVAAQISARESTDFAGGAHTWYEPYLQDRGTQGGRKLVHDAADIIRRWADDGYEWIGPLPKIDHYRGPMFFRVVKNSVDIRPALAAIERGRRGDVLVGPGSPDPDVARVAETGVPWWAIVGGAAVFIV